MIKSVLDKIKIKSTIFINNRKLLDEILEDEKSLKRIENR